LNEKRLNPALVQRGGMTELAGDWTAL